MMSGSLLFIEYCFRPDLKFIRLAFKDQAHKFFDLHLLHIQRGLVGLLEHSLAAHHQVTGLLFDLGKYRFVPDVVVRQRNGRLRNRVRSKREMEDPQGSIYLVKIEKGNDWKFIKVNNWETEVIGEYIKELVSR